VYCYFAVFFFCIVQCPLEYNSTPQINHTFAITRSLPSISHLNMSTVQTDLQRKMPWSDGVHVSEPDHLEPFFFRNKLVCPGPLYRYVVYRRMPFRASFNGYIAIQPSIRLPTQSLCLLATHACRVLLSKHRHLQSWMVARELRRNGLDLHVLLLLSPTPHCASCPPSRTVIP
jgi:hypothetical protein